MQNHMAKVLRLAWPDTKLSLASFSLASVSAVSMPGWPRQWNCVT